MKFLFKIITLIFLINISIYSQINFNNQNIFLNGANVAWVNFARDIGYSSTNFDSFEDIFKTVHNSGGNSMRLWLHTNGVESPHFNNSGFVDDPGTNTISDLKIILDLANEYEIGLMLCLWSFDMLRISFGDNVTSRAKLMLTDTSYTNAYINNALIPIVDSLKGHPAILAWEIFNEPEGMSNEFGWDFNYHVPMLDIQRFINLVSGTIHRTDSTALVTNGSWSFKAMTDVETSVLSKSVIDDFSAEQTSNIEEVFNEKYSAQYSIEKIIEPFTVAGTNVNYYSDDRLIDAGGDVDGTLDFYTVHYYSWAGTSLSPFHHSYSYWKLDKPLAVTEFWMSETYGIDYTNLYERLYTNNYAGAMGWQWYDGEPHRSRLSEAMTNMYIKYPENIDLNPQPGNIYYFSAIPNLIERGDSSLLQWKSSSGTILTLNGDTIENEGSIYVFPESTTSYILTSSGEVSQSLTKKVEVYKSGTILKFSAFPKQAAEGEPVKLIWETSSGSNVYLDGDKVSEDDSLTVYPASSTVFYLYVFGELNDSGKVAIEILPQNEVNRALDNPIIASSTINGNTNSIADNLVDGLFTTGWTSEYYDNQWVEIDLLQNYTVNKLELYWQTNYAQKYRIGISSDKIVWNVIRQELEGTGGNQIFDSLDVSGRYLKLMLDKSATSRGFSLSEIQVFGISELSTNIEEKNKITDHFSLSQNFPNPFNPSTEIRFLIPKLSSTKLEVFNIIGELKKTLINSTLEKGNYKVTFDGSKFASGVYIYRLSVGNFVKQVKMILLK